MATSGSASKSFTSWDSLRFSWEQKSQSIENNTTTIAWKLELVAGQYGRIDASATCPWTVTVNGTKYTGQVNVGISNNTTKTLASGETTIAHNADGSKVFSYSFNQYFGITFSGEWITDVGGSGSGTLNVIARASQPSLVTWPETTQNVGNFGAEFSIHMNRLSSAFTHTVRYEYGSRKGTIATNVGTGTTWAVPLSFMNDIPNATRGSGRIYVDTYNGSTLIGTKYTGFTATVPSSVKPTCSLTLEDTTGIDEIYGSPVQGLSNIRITVNATLAYSSPISSTSITAAGVKHTGTTATTGVLKTSGSSTVTATVKDARGRSGSASYTMTVQAYTAPRISSLTVHRCNSDGTANDQGTHIRVLFSAAISSMSSKNTAGYVLRYKKGTATTWTEVALSALNNVFTVSNQEYIFAADESSSYDVSVTATDRHSSATRATSASTAFSLMDWHPSGTGIRFGGVAELQNTLENDLDMKQVGNSYSFQPNSFNGEKGYTLLAVLTLSAKNLNAPIVFEIVRRNSIRPMVVYVRFANSSETTDPDLSSLTYEGDNYGVFLVKTAASTWKMYIDNTMGWSNPCVQRWYTTNSQGSRITVDFPSEQVTTLPNPYYRATPVIVRSILDAFMPVGFVLTLYSHADPNDMYPGTTWTRLSGGFLWASQAGDIIGQTGGVKEVTLTLDQIPRHSHGSVYSGVAEGTKNTAWLASGGDKMAYGALYAGGGAAHTNMPPYIQVSIWRRTA